MNDITTREMKRLDEATIRDYGISSLILMENAGRGIAELAGRMMKRGKKKVLVIAGKGNNGGDGFVAARHLANRGHQVSVVLLAEPRDLKLDPKTNFEILKKMDIPVHVFASHRAVRRIRHLLSNAELVLDGIFGVGLTRPASGIFYEAIEFMNMSRKPILAIDIPSGLNSDTGQVLGTAVRARATGTLGRAKRGLFVGDGPKHAGRVTVLDISIPRSLFDAKI
ncbi:MAG: NAD(P)H-hydrate epimerase [Omnitrophica bacterium RIFCSPLOWO2_12_FULL_50_11]|nr:MAG: NAD(P)H-hydrate epimerase [Omnitrophica bacterium RIFCSPLOWO2_12_FULL_50_11]